MMAAENHVRHHQPLETHARRKHGDDFGVFRQLRGEENNGDKHKQRAEQVGVVGDEVQIIIEGNSLERRFVLDKVINVFIDVKHNGD